MSPAERVVPGVHRRDPRIAQRPFARLAEQCAGGTCGPPGASRGEGGSAVNPGRNLWAVRSPEVRQGRVRRWPAELEQWRLPGGCRARPRAIPDIRPGGSAGRRRHRASAGRGCAGRPLAGNGSPAGMRREQRDAEPVARHWSAVYRRGACGAWAHSEALRNGTGGGGFRQYRVKQQRFSAPSACASCRR
jgi:hypothetical protein